MAVPFSGDDSYDVTKWFEDIENIFDMLACSERDRFLCVRRVLAGTAKLFLRTATIRTYDELKDALIEEFGRAFSVTEVIQQLRTRFIRQGESVRHYILEMQAIAVRAPIVEVELVDCIVDGMRDHSANISILHSAQCVI